MTFKKEHQVPSGDLITKEFFAHFYEEMQAVNDALKNDKEGYIFDYIEKEGYTLEKTYI